MANRIHLIQRKLQGTEADAVWISFLPDIRWACGFTGSNGVLLVRRDAAFFITDRRYEEQAAAEVEGAFVSAPGYDLVGHVRDELWLAGKQRVLYQSDHLTVSAWEALTNAFPEVTWEPVKEWMVEEVAQKEESEIAAIRAAQQVTDRVFQEILPYIRPGVTEQELAAEIVYRHLRHGAQKMAFDPIVAAGSNGALPHARPTFRKFQPGNLIVIDMGCVLDGYASDMTRTVALGEPEIEGYHAYEVVREAQADAVQAARAGMTTKALDAVARKRIELVGMGAYFAHGLGHGIGLQTHEWPRVSYATEVPLPVNAVITIEPGVYLPGQFGVRIEDIVVLRESGCENLTTSPKTLLVL